MDPSYIRNVQTFHAMAMQRTWVLYIAKNQIEAMQGKNVPTSQLDIGSHI